MWLTLYFQNEKFKQTKKTCKGLQSFTGVHLSIKFSQIGKVIFLSHKSAVLSLFVLQVGATYIIEMLKYISTREGFTIFVGEHFLRAIIL